MTTAAKRLLFWTPRILCIAFALFLGIFALDVFDGQHGFWETMLGLFMHLLPSTILILVVLFLVWRREWIGTVIFCALGVFYIISFWGRFPWFTYAAIAGPLFLVGILFYFNWKYRALLRAK